VGTADGASEPSPSVRWLLFGAFAGALILALILIEVVIFPSSPKRNYSLVDKEF